jgi:hypothetical protein
MDAVYREPKKTKAAVIASAIPSSSFCTSEYGIAKAITAA